MNELFDYLQKQIGKEDCPIISVGYIHSITDWSIEVITKDDSAFRIRECPNYTKFVKDNPVSVVLKPTKEQKENFMKVFEENK
jgi:hypothetical protein